MTFRSKEFRDDIETKTQQLRDSVNGPHIDSVNKTIERLTQKKPTIPKKMSQRQKNFMRHPDGFKKIF